jgi:hypothetical protein
VQRFGYRQLMYFVVVRSIVTAVRGARVGWNKLERRATAALEPIAERGPVMTFLAMLGRPFAVVLIALRRAFPRWGSREAG